MNATTLLAAAVALAPPPALLPAPSACAGTATCEGAGGEERASLPVAEPGSSRPPASSERPVREPWSLALGGGATRLGLPGGVAVKSPFLRGAIAAPGVSTRLGRVWLELGVEGFRWTPTEAGLPVSDVQVSALAWSSPGRFARIGAGVNAGYVGFVRATTGETVWANTYGLVLAGEAAPLRWRSGALFLRATGQLRAANGLHGWSTPSSLSLLAGIRFGWRASSPAMRPPAPRLEPVRSGAVPAEPPPIAAAPAQPPSGAPPEPPPVAAAPAQPPSGAPPEPAPAVALRSEAAAPAGKEPSICFRGRPKTECRSFMLTEITVYFGGPTVHNMDEAMADVRVGAMVNVGTRSAGGIALVIAGTDVGGRSGVEARYRRWLARRLALDVGADLLAGQGPTVYDLTAATSLVDTVAVSIRLQMTRQPGGWDVHLYPGIRLGSWAALIASAAAPVALMAAMILSGPPS